MDKFKKGQEVYSQLCEGVGVIVNKISNRGERGADGIYTVTWSVGERSMEAADLCTEEEAKERRKLVQGRKDDQGKPRWGLLPFEAVSQVVDVLTFGAKKYAPDNWRHVPDARNRYFDAAMRHLVTWKQGERKDPESGHHHLAHAACCVLFALALDPDMR